MPARKGAQPTPCCACEATFRYVNFWWGITPPDGRADALATRYDAASALTFSAELMPAHPHPNTCATKQPERAGGGQEQERKVGHAAAGRR
eukprot:gene28902-35462_t